MSKGSRRRGQQVSSETMDTNWANTFGKKKPLEQLAELLDEAGLKPYIHKEGCAMWNSQPCDKGCGPEKKFKRWMCKSCNSHYTEIEIKFPCTTCGGDDFISEDYGAHAEVKPYDTIDEK